MDALFFVRIRHIGSTSICNNGVVWMDSVAATASPVQWAGPCPTLHQSVQRPGRCNDPAVDVTPDKFGFGERLSEGRDSSGERSSTKTRRPNCRSNSPSLSSMARHGNSALPLAVQPATNFQLERHVQEMKTT